MGGPLTKPGPLAASPSRRPPSDDSSTAWLSLEDEGSPPDEMLFHMRRPRGLPTHYLCFWPRGWVDRVIRCPGPKHCVLQGGPSGHNHVVLMVPAQPQELW